VRRTVSALPGTKRGTHQDHKDKKQINSSWCRRAERGKKNPRSRERSLRKCIWKSNLFGTDRSQLKKKFKYKRKEQFRVE